MLRRTNRGYTPAHMQKKYVFLAGVALVVILLDQYTKFLTLERLTTAFDGATNKAGVFFSAAPEAAKTLPTASTANEGANAAITTPAMMSVLWIWNQVRRFQRSIQGVATSENPNPTREPRVAS